MARRVRIFASAVRRGKSKVVAGHRKGESGARKAFVFFGTKEPPKQKSLGLRSKPAAKKAAAKRPTAKRSSSKRAPSARRATRRR